MEIAMFRIKIEVDNATRTFINDTVDDFRTNVEILRHNWREAKKQQRLTNITDTLGDLSQEEKQTLLDALNK